MRSEQLGVGLNVVAITLTIHLNTNCPRPASEMDGCTVEEVWPLASARQTCLNRGKGGSWLSLSAIGNLLARQTSAPPGTKRRWLELSLPARGRLLRGRVVRRSTLPFQPDTAADWQRIELLHRVAAFYA